jgi:endonuclease/exonuclease/phosphatase family metal-dependent hydrolase
MVALLVAGCSNASGAGSVVVSAGPPPPDDAVHVVNLNAAMGYRAGKGDPAGTDPTAEDLDLLARDIVNQGGDIANLQEMALPAARELQGILREKTGNEWQLNWCHAVPATFYPGKSRDERPAYDRVSSGNAQLIRIGDGIQRQKPLTLDDANDDQGIVLPSGARAFVGAEITTANGVIDVYTTHLALARQVPDEKRAADVRRIQDFAQSRPNPVILTGDFNQTIDEPNSETAAAIKDFMGKYGYTDAAAGAGVTIDQKHPEQDARRIDYILTHGVPVTDTKRFVSHESDHWGLTATIAMP